MVVKKVGDMNYRITYLSNLLAYFEIINDCQRPSSLNYSTKILITYFKVGPTLQRFFQSEK